MSQDIKPLRSDKVTWLADQIFTAFPGEVTGLKLYVMNCGCIYHQRVFRDGDVDSKVGIYRDAEDDPCKVRVRCPMIWKDRVDDEVVVYSSGVDKRHGCQAYTVDRYVSMMYRD